MHCSSNWAWKVMVENQEGLNTKGEVLPQLWSYSCLCLTHLMRCRWLWPLAHYILVEVSSSHSVMEMRLTVACELGRRCSLVLRPFPAPVFDCLHTAKVIKNWSRGRPRNEANELWIYMPHHVLTGHIWVVCLCFPWVARCVSCLLKMTSATRGPAILWGGWTNLPPSWNIRTPQLIWKSYWVL